MCEDFGNFSVSQIVWDVVRGRGRVTALTRVLDEPQIEVIFDAFPGRTSTYNPQGVILPIITNVRTLFFSPPVVTGDVNPPLSPPKLNDIYMFVSTINPAESDTYQITRTDEEFHILTNMIDAAEWIAIPVDDFTKVDTKIYKLVPNTQGVLKYLPLSA